MYIHPRPRPGPRVGPQIKNKVLLGVPPGFPSGIVHAGETTVVRQAESRIMTLDLDLDPVNPEQRRGHVGWRVLAATTTHLHLH